MSLVKKSMPQWVRVCLILGLTVAFVTSAAYSMLVVRYPVDGKATGELAITERSLVHDVERGADGSLVTPGLQPEPVNPATGQSGVAGEARVAKSGPSGGKKVTAPSSTKKATVKAATKPAAKKPVAAAKPPAVKPKAKKPVVKKVAPKPAPAKPAPKKSKPKACPT